MLGKLDQPVNDGVSREISADSLFMQRCVALAKLAAGRVAPNPMVGAVLVHEGRIIGEGYHQHYGQAHAEVNCIASVAEADRKLIPQSVLYVSLEPCAHHGKTPPCADLIIREKIPRVVVGCRDPFPLVNGKGIEKLRAAGVAVVTGVMEKECRELNKRFFLFHERQRPYIILKWAQTADGFIGKMNHARVMISNEYTNRLVHRWRSEEASILVGTDTVLHDNPELTVRNWQGVSPIRLVIDRNLRLPATLKIFDQKTKTIVFNTIKSDQRNNFWLYKIDPADDFFSGMLKAIHAMNIQSVLVEGGAKTLRAFIETGYWDEARIITNEQLRLGEGVGAPFVRSAKILSETKLFSDQIITVENDRPE